jgi:hypothetical protein
MMYAAPTTFARARLSKDESLDDVVSACEPERRVCA